MREQDLPQASVSAGDFLRSIVLFPALTVDAKEIQTTGQPVPTRVSPRQMFGLAAWMTWGKNGRLWPGFRTIGWFYPSL